MLKYLNISIFIPFYFYFQLNSNRTMFQPSARLLNRRTRRRRRTPSSTTTPCAQAPRAVPIRSTGTRPPGAAQGSSRGPSPGRLQPSSTSFRSTRGATNAPLGTASATPGAPFPSGNSRNLSPSSPTATSFTVMRKTMPRGAKRTTGKKRRAKR